MHGDPFGFLGFEALRVPNGFDAVLSGVFFFPVPSGFHIFPSAWERCFWAGLRLSQKERCRDSLPRSFHATQHRPLTPDKSAKRSHSHRLAMTESKSQTQQRDMNRQRQSKSSMYCNTEIDEGSRVNNKTRPHGKPPQRYRSEIAPIETTLAQYDLSACRRSPPRRRIARVPLR